MGILHVLLNVYLKMFIKHLNTKLRQWIITVQLILGLHFNCSLLTSYYPLSLLLFIFFKLSANSYIIDPD